MKTFLSFLLSIALLASVVPVAKAQNENANANDAMHDVIGSVSRAAGENAYRIAKSNTARISALQALGVFMIGQRTAGLTRELNRVQNAQRLSTDTRTQLIAQIQTNIDDLATLKDKISSETDLAALKTDVKSIVISYRVYIVVMPQVRGLAVVDALKTYAERLTTVKDKLQAKTTELQQAGNDTTAIQADIDQAVAKMNDAQDAITRAETDFTDMQVNDPTGSTTHKSAGITEFQTARQDLREARNLLSKAIGLIKVMTAQNRNTNSDLNANAATNDNANVS